MSAPTKERSDARRGSLFPHRHRWHVIDRTVLDSPLDKLLQVGMKKFDTHSQGDTRTMTHRPVIVTSRCVRCGTERVERV